MKVTDTNKVGNINGLKTLVISSSTVLWSPVAIAAIQSEGRLVFIKIAITYMNNFGFSHNGKIHETIVTS